LHFPGLVGTGSASAPVPHRYELMCVPNLRRAHARCMILTWIS